MRELAGKVAHIASLQIQQEKKQLWCGINDLQPIRPTVYAYQLPWHELNVDDELNLLTENEFARAIETELRQKLYLWNHMPVDMVIEDVLFCPLAVSVTPVLDVRQETLGTDDRSMVVSHHYEPQIKDESDIEKIKLPIVIHDLEKSAEMLDFYQNTFSDIIRVEQRGPAGFRMSIWDRIVEWTGVQEILLDLILRPEYVHAICERATTAYCSIVEQYEKLGIIPRNNNDRLTSDGALGYNSTLPVDASPETYNLWGGCAAQIFGDVDPEMHEEFSLKYEQRYLSKFGLAYYGCCEPLHKKLFKLKQNFPNLRKVSCSPWADVSSMAEQCGKKLVVSIKPNPAILAEDVYNPERARRYLEERIAPAKDCAVEIVLKDVSTIKYDPKRLWDWCRMAIEVACDSAD